jgi:hypothetical protein
MPPCTGKCNFNDVPNPVLALYPIWAITCEILYMFFPAMVQELAAVGMVSTWIFGMVIVRVLRIKVNFG